MKRFFAVLVLAASFAACASLSDKTQSLQLGMTQAQVENILGDGYKVIASRYSADGQPMSVWQYQDGDKGAIYWIYLKGNKLVQWGTPASIQGMPEVQSMNIPQ